MIKVTKLGVVLSKTELGFENAGVLNPAIIAEGKIIHLFYRAVRKGNYSTIGYCKLDSAVNVVERFEVPVLFSAALPLYSVQVHKMLLPIPEGEQKKFF